MEFAATRAQNLPAQVGNPNRRRAILRFCLRWRTSRALERRARVAAVSNRQEKFAPSVKCYPADNQRVNYLTEYGIVVLEENSDEEH